MEAAFLAELLEIRHPSLFHELLGQSRVKPIETHNDQASNLGPCFAFAYQQTKCHLEWVRDDDAHCEEKRTQ
jgi:hypothetical protein